MMKLHCTLLCIFSSFNITVIIIYLQQLSDYDLQGKRIFRAFKSSHRIVHKIYFHKTCTYMYFYLKEEKR